jgi:hypothetical protein
VVEVEDFVVRFFFFNCVSVNLARLLPFPVFFIVGKFDFFVLWCRLWLVFPPPFPFPFPPPPFSRTGILPEPSSTAKSLLLLFVEFIRD